MTFLNWIMLAGLGGVSIPIIIHLLNRHRARIVNWGAMRFLLEVIAQQQRRIRIEELILLLLRCLWVALLVLAMARPLLPSRSSVPWMIVLPAVLIAGVCLLLGVRFGWSRRLGKGMMLAAAALVLLGFGAMASEYIFQKQIWSRPSQQRDIAIIIDASNSMRARHAGPGSPSAFDLALAEARAVVESAGPGDAMSILLVGSAVDPLVPAPIADTRELLANLDTAQPLGGTFQAVDAIKAANISLAKNRNPAKQIVIITDGQDAGWDLARQDRWDFVASILDGEPPTQLVVRTLGVPQQFDNLAAAAVTPSRDVIGTDRPVRFDVEITNTGTSPMIPARVELTAEAATPLTDQPLVALAAQASEIAPGASEIVTFEHHFRQPGRYVLNASVTSDDDLIADNSISRAVHVLKTLPVLVVDGSPSPMPLVGAAAYIDIALCPPPPDDADDSADNAEQNAEKNADDLIAPTVIAAPDIAREDLNKYAVVILANVPRLTQQVAAELAAYVNRGGGLLISPGPSSAPAFYNAWRGPDGEPLVPATLVRRDIFGDSPLRLATKSFTHPALQAFGESARSDIDATLVNAAWKLDIAAADSSVRVAATFDNGSPAVVDRRFGKGSVLLTAFGLDRRDSNLPTLKAFAPLMHETANYLARTTLDETNIQPGSQLALDLTRDGRQIGASNGGGEWNSLEILTPSKRRRMGRMQLTGSTLRIRFDDTAEPGLYRLLLPAQVAEAYVPDASAGLPFVVTAGAGESTLTPLDATDFNRLAERMDFVAADSRNEMIASLTGRIPGMELWRYLALAALMTMVAEVAMSRWIAVRRRVDQARPVTFAAECEDPRTTRERARKILQPQTAGKEG